MWFPLYMSKQTVVGSSSNVIIFQHPYDYYIIPYRNVATGHSLYKSVGTHCSSRSMTCKFRAENICTVGNQTQQVSVYAS